MKKKGHKNSKKIKKKTKKEEKRRKRETKGGRKGRKEDERRTKEDAKSREDRNNVDSNLGYFFDGWGFPSVERKKISKMFEKDFKYDKKRASWSRYFEKTPKID